MLISLAPDLFKEGLNSFLIHVFFLFNPPVAASISLMVNGPSLLALILIGISTVILIVVQEALSMHFCWWATWFVPLVSSFIYSCILV